MSETFEWSVLRRYPDVEAHDLVAVDATDRLVLDTAADAIAAAAPGEVAVLGDRHGALALGAVGLHEARSVRVFQDALLGERALAHNARAVGLAAEVRSLPLGEELLAGARIVLMQLPRQLAELDEWAEAIARHADPSVLVVAGGRVKHMTTTMNEVLARSFSRVDVGHARQKSRTLTASGARPESGASRYPVAAELTADELPGGRLQIRAHGGAFAGASLDIGTRFLLGFLPRFPDAADVIDLGSGTGVLAASVAIARPRCRVVAVDQSAAATASTAATAAANVVADRVRAVREDALTERPDSSADLIVCNPPFHTGAAVHDDLAARMLADARRVLRPGGEVWTVFNSSLRYGPMLSAVVGPTERMGSNAKFTVTRSRPAAR